MLTQVAKPAYFPFSAGVDWITATASESCRRFQFDQIADTHHQNETEAGRDVSTASVRDYKGLRSQGLFSGVRSRDSILIASGPSADRLCDHISLFADNVSRLDLQVTLWSGGEVTNLACDTYEQVKQARARRERPRAYSLIQNLPAGETLYVNKRSSDNYGRLYDWGVAHSAGEAGICWRYEVEYKRRDAAFNSSLVAGAINRPSVVGARVHGWFSRRGIEPAWSLSEHPAIQERSVSAPLRDPLAWFRQSVSVTVARLHKRHGLAAVVEALGLSELVTINTERRRETDAT